MKRAVAVILFLVLCIAKPIYAQSPEVAHCDTSVLSLAKCVDCLFQKYSAEKANGDFSSAYLTHVAYVRFKDSLDKQQRVREANAKELANNYETQAALDRKENERKLAITVEKEKRQRTIMYSVLAGLALCGLFAVFLIKQVRIITAQKRAIEEQKLMVEEKQKAILDSFYYARRIQRALMPSPDIIQRHLWRLKKN